MKKFLNSSLFQSTSIYTVTNALSRGTPILMLPILTRYLTPNDYGIVSLFLVIVSFIYPFAGLSIHGAVGRQYFERDKIDFPAYIGNCLLILVMSALSLCLIVLLFSRYISGITHFPENWLWALVLVSSGQFIIEVILVLWQVQMKPVAYGLYQLLQTLVNVGLLVLFVVVLGLTWKGMIVAQLLSVLILDIAALVILHRGGWIKYKINPPYIRHALQFGVPLIPHSLGAYLIAMVDRLFIVNFISVSEAGLYDVGSQIGMTIRLLTYSFNQAWVPWLYHQLKKNDQTAKLAIVRFTYLYFVVVLLLAVLLKLIAPAFLAFFVGKDFVSASRFVFWIALGYAFNGMYYMVAGYIFYAERTSILAWITFTTAVFNVLFIYALIKTNGSLGVAQATAFAFLLCFILSWILSAKVYKMPWLLRKQ